MIRALIVDDEPLARERVRTLLAEHPDVRIVGEACDGESALNALGETDPNVVFLDVQMPGLTGLEVAEAWRREGSLPVLIFVTAYDQFALEAFRIHALDYITKPIDPERFAESVGRARELLHPRAGGDLDRRLQALIQTYERRLSVRPHLVVRDETRYILVPTAEIHCLEATGNYVRLHCERERHLLRSTLSVVEARLDAQQFVRVHRSWIVNVAEVREAQPVTKASWILVTRSGLKVPVGAQHHSALERILR